MGFINLHLQYLRHAEIQNLRHVFFGDEDIGRLDIAMDDSFLVRRFQPRSNLDGNLQPFGCAEAEAAVADVIAQRLAIQELHDDEGMPFVLVKLMYRADVGMIERRDRMCFALEALAGSGIVAHLFRQKLQRHRAP